MAALARLVLLGALLIACVGAASGGSSGNKGTLSFRVRSRDVDWGRAGRRRLLLRNATVPLHGAVKDFGYFYATLYLGTPPRKFAVIVDTGSTMTYVPCSSCGAGCGPNHQDAAFDPHASATAALIPCESPKCACGSPSCGCTADQCTYTRSYAEQSSSSGILLEDRLSLHDAQEGAPVIFGCETHETGEIFKQRADGLFGLGNSAASVVNQLVAAGAIEDVFSLCFGAVEGDGALLLGDTGLPPNVDLQYTPLVASSSHPYYYNVRMLGMGVDGKQLDVEEAAYAQGYGTVLDSGTTFTYVPSSAFRTFSAAVTSFALAAGLHKVPGPDPQYNDICFGGAPHHNDHAALAKVFPSMQIMFDQGTELTLGPINYLFVHTFNAGKYCLGVFDNGAQGTLLGGITFRNVLVRYDRGQGRVGFGAAQCRELGEAGRPLCSAFAAEAGDAAAKQAESEGDCQPAPPSRQQQNEEPAPPGAGGLPPAQAPPDSSSSSGSSPGVQAGPPTGDEGGQQQGDGGDGVVEEDVADLDPLKPLSDQQQPPADPGQQPSSSSSGGKGPSLDSAAAAAAAGSPPGEGSGYRGPPQAQKVVLRITMVHIGLGLLMGVIALLLVAFVVALRQPGTRERLRGAFSFKPYRPMDDGSDVEAAPLASAGEPSDGHPPERVGPLPPQPVERGAGSFSSVVSAAGVERSAGSGNAKAIALAELTGGGLTEGKRMGITTPQKLQRSVSNSAEEAAAALAAGPLHPGSAGDGAGRGSGPLGTPRSGATPRAAPLASPRVLM